MHAVEHHIVAGQFGDALATPLRMETHGAGRKRVIFGVVDLVEERGNVFIVIVAEHDARMFERHGEVAVEAAIGHDHHRHRIDSAGLRVAAAEEVADRALHGRGLLAIPIEFQDQVAKHVRTGRGGSVGDRHPNMADHARTVHIHQSDALPAFTVWMQGLPLRDGPSALAAVAAAPLPPVGFSAFTQRVRPGAATASESIGLRAANAPNESTCIS